MVSRRFRMGAARRYAVGLMSGTSVDGIDAAVVEISDRPDGNPDVKLIAFENQPYAPQLREEIFSLFDPAKATVDRVGMMNMRLGELFAEAALSVISKAGLSPADISVIGSHGQTIYHAPEAVSVDSYDLRFTVQIGEGAVIAARTGIPCVSDFRIADMAVGGQGAPLVPFTEYLLYRESGRTKLLQNIGGIGNMTVLPAGEGPDAVFAFDTGPGNMLIDGVVSRLYPGQSMDTGGAIAKSGRVQEELLRRLQSDPYYRQPPPKSTGREWFGSSYVDWLIRLKEEHQTTAEDLITTVTMLTAWSIGDAYRSFVKPQCSAEVMIVGGGGSFNLTLMEMLKSEMSPMGIQVLTQEEVGWNSDAKEAIAFAVLADHTVAGLPNHLPSVTGAERPMILGKISL